MNQLQNDLAINLVKAGLSEGAAAGVSKTVAQTVALGAGAAVGGMQGAGMALNVDANNRQLHPEERTRAQKLAAASGGKYTAQQIEDAIRNSGNSALGEDINAGAVLKNTGDKTAIYDTGAHRNLDGDGKSLVQVLPNGERVDPALAAFIAPTSGAGAAKHRGRANRPGVEALYLAMQTETAIRVAANWSDWKWRSVLIAPGDRMKGSTRKREMPAASRS